MRVMLLVLMMPMMFDADELDPNYIHYARGLNKLLLMALEIDHRSVNNDYLTGN